MANKDCDNGLHTWVLVDEEPHGGVVIRRYECVECSQRTQSVGAA